MSGLCLGGYCYDVVISCNITDFMPATSDSWLFQINCNIIRNTRVQIISWWQSGNYIGERGMLWYRDLSYYPGLHARHKWFIIVPNKLQYYQEYQSPDHFRYHHRDTPSSARWQDIWSLPAYWIEGILNGSLTMIWLPYHKVEKTSLGPISRLSAETPHDHFWPLILYDHSRIEAAQQQSHATSTKLV